jgi:hypothetical protein
MFLSAIVEKLKRQSKDDFKVDPKTGEICPSEKVATSPSSLHQQTRQKER